MFLTAGLQLAFLPFMKYVFQSAQINESGQSMWCSIVRGLYRKIYAYHPGLIVCRRA